MFFLVAWCVSVFFTIWHVKNSMKKTHKIGVWWYSKNPKPQKKFSWTPQAQKHLVQSFGQQLLIETQLFLDVLGIFDGTSVILMFTIKFLCGITRWWTTVRYTTLNIYIYVYLIKPMWRKQHWSFKEVYINWRAWLVAIFPWKPQNCQTLKGCWHHHFPLKPTATITTCPENSIGRDAQVIPAESLLRVSVGDQHDRQATETLHPPRSLTVRPWKVTFPKRKESFSGRLFPGASC